MPLARLLTVLVAMMPSAIASAQPLKNPVVRVFAEGACPTGQEVEASLTSWPISVTHDQQPAWGLLVERDNAALLSRLVLQSTTGRPAFERMIAGADCAAIAGAAAAIVAAHFMELHLIGEAPPAVAEVVPLPSPWYLSATVLGSGLLYIGPTASSWSGEATAGARRGSWGLFLAAGLAAPTTQEARSQDAVDHVRRSELSFRLDFSRLFAGRTFWIEPGLGASILLSQVTALDLPGRPSVARSDFGPDAILVVGAHLSAALSVAASMTGAYLLRQDRYTISPEGTVARSPSARLTMGLGFRYERKL
jgi:hypothetical protein